MNEKPKFQVLTAGGAGSTKSSISHRNNTTKPSNKVTESASNVSELHSIIQPSMSQNHPSKGELEYEIPVEDDGDVEDIALNDGPTNNKNNNNEQFKLYSDNRKVTFATKLHTNPIPPSKHSSGTTNAGMSDVVWLVICFVGIMASFVCYGLLLEYTTSGGRKLHELSFLFVTSGLYTVTAAAGRYVRDETPTTIPPRQFALLGLTSMGSTWCSVRSLRYDELSCYL
jgi:hypothetical protein